MRFGFCPFFEFVERGESVLFFEAVGTDCYFYEFGEKGAVGADMKSGIEIVEQSS